MIPTDRSSLRFAEQTRSAFRFLESDWGFEAVDELLTIVRYERRPTYVHVYHGRISFEVGVEVGCTSTGGVERYELSAIVELSAPDVAKQYQLPTMLTEAGVGRALEEAAGLLRMYGKDVAAGDAAVLLRLKALVRARADAWMAKSNASVVRPKAEAAFRQRDYELAARLYASIEPSLLSKAELRKLEIARKRGGH